MPLPVDFVPLFMAILVITSPVNADTFLNNGVTAHRGLLYAWMDNGVLVCFDGKTGIAR